MPRNSAGVYTLPAGNPVVTNTVITPVWANPTMSDIAQELTNSLDRQGRGGMLAPFKFLDGTIAAPGMSWINEPTSGWYRAGLSDFRFSVGGIDQIKVTGAGVTIAGNAIYNGNVTAAGIINAGGFNATGTPIPANGMYLPAANQLGFATNGVINATFDPGGHTVFSSMALSKAGAIDLNYQISLTGVEALWFGSNNSGAANPLGAPTGAGYIFTNQNRPFVIGTLGVVRLAVGATGGVVIHPTTGGVVSLNVLNTAGVSGLVVTSATTTGAADAVVVRTSSVANSFVQGPNLYLGDTGAGTNTVLQHSGGQFELWHSAPGTAQIMKVDPFGQVIFPRTGNVLFLGANDAANANAQKSLWFNPGGFGAPAAVFNASTGDKLVLYRDAAGNYDGTIGVGTSSEIWFKSFSPAPGEGRFDFYANDATARTLSIRSGGLYTNLKDGNGDQELGFRQLHGRVFTASTSIQNSDAGRAVVLGGNASGLVLTLPTGGMTVDMLVTVKNQGSFPLVITSPNVPLYWMTGALPILNGNRTLAAGGVATVHFVAGAQWEIWGMGVT